MQADTRDGTRGRDSVLGYRMGTELTAVASFGDSNAPGRLVQLSLEHLTLHLDAHALPPVPGQAASVVLGQGERWATSLDAEVVEVRGARPEVSLRFVSPPLDAGRRIVSVLEALRDNGLLLPPETRPVWKERIDRPERVARICEALVGRQARGVARSADGQRVGVSAALFEPLAGVMAWRFDGPVPVGPFSLEVFGYSSVVHASVTEARQEGDLVMTPAPTELVRYRHRWLRRAPPSSPCVLSFDHPLWPQVHVRRPVLDLSYEGLAFMTEPDEDLLYPGLRQPVLEVAMEGLPPVRLRAEVRNISSTAAGRRCGMSVRPLDAEGARAWRALVEAQMHPSTRVEGDWSEATWKLLEGSGYFGLPGKTPEDFTEERPWFDATQERLEGRTRLGYRVVRPAGESLEATLSVVKPFEGTWMAHQLARQHVPGMRSSAREALRDIYLRGYEPTQVDPDVKWLIAFCEASVRWVRFTKFDFARWYEHTGQACLVPFRLMEAEVERDWALPPDVEVAEPTDAERARFFQELERTRPVAYREALDLVPERFDLVRVRTRWEEAGLDRARALRVARVDGKPVALAVFESAQPGLNLFNVLDGVRVVTLVDDAKPEVQRAMLALLGHAAAWYRALGRRVFVHYVESACVEYVEHAALADLGDGRLWAISASLLPEFLEHLCEATTPRPGA
ncbi:PilZ domain-containing protein [Myxococcus sp. K15C18031901]|uniref:PilZ domain-containing protein n=1 Tax=Myxococcus dinghuensis TaxID=2906761 RepID=UPI0020A7047C|nr:PilZ domain-containing protein [Myxococcus dinghuensis]MCP3102551.1 PilZ domain-containing protein [Myxococcus dinghuensis]